MEIPALISDLALMLIIAGVMTIIFKKLGQPLVLGYIIAGLLTGPYLGFFPSVTDTASIHTWSEIGIIILMFSLGLEFNLHKLASVGGTAIITAITEVVCMLLVGFGVGQLLGWDTMNSIFLGGMLAMSSTTIIIKAFDDLKLKGQKFTELVFGTLVIEDIAGIFMMVILATMSVSQGISGGELTLSIAKMLFYLALWLILGIYLLPTILKKAQSLMNDETLLIVSLGICLGMVILAHYLGFSSALGAFLAGSLLAGTIHAERVEHLNEPIKNLFGAVFFISVGMMVDPALIWQYAVPIVIITLITIFGKSLFSALGIILSGQSLRTAILCGCSLAQIGEFAFIIATLGMSLGVISEYVYPIIVSVSVITTFTTPYSIGMADKIYDFLNKRLPTKITNYLNRYTSEDQSETEKDGDWAAFIKQYFSRLALYVIIIMGIILAGAFIAWPFLADLLAERQLDSLPAAVITVLLTLIAMSPFLKQVLTQRSKYFTSLWFKSKSNHLPLLVLAFLRLAIVVLLIMLPLQLIFEFSTLPILIAAIVIAAIISRSERLIAPYLNMEARFLTNFNEIKLEQRRSEDVNHRWLDEQIYVSSFICTPDCPAENKSLDKLRWGPLLGITVIKIIRNKKHINIPERNEKILSKDVVVVMGSPIQLDNLQQWIKLELHHNEKGEYYSLHDFINKQEQYEESDQLLCCAVEVEKESKLEGMSIKESDIKDGWGGLLIGLERNLLPIIAPDINMRIQTNDLIWVLGPQRMAGKLARAELL